MSQNSKLHCRNLYKLTSQTLPSGKTIEYGYNTKGELQTISIDGTAYISDIKTNQNGLVSYKYADDTIHTRVSKTVNGVTTYYIYNEHMLQGEYDQNGDLIKEYVYNGSTLIAVLTATTIEKIYADHLDTPRRVADNANNIIWKWESSPFGETKPTGTYTLNLRFPGQYFDSETGTHYNINRDYNPVTGRYIQSDPIGFDGGYNTFGYVFRLTHHNGLVKIS
jgi:RHS repeat-associated protein